MQLFINTNYKIIDKRKIAYIFSATLILISIISLIMHGGPRYNVDFTGGTIVQLKFEKNIVIEQVRSILSEHQFGDAEIKHYGAENELMIRIGLQNHDKDAITKVEGLLEKGLADNPFIVERVETVGPKIGHELILDALAAIFWAMVLILFSVMWRFEFKFSIGAIVALIHDITITMGIFSVFNLEISAPIIAAVLTIVGYSLNDTIVVYDRIRENLKASKKNLADLVDVIYMAAPRKPRIGAVDFSIFMARRDLLTALQDVTYSVRRLIGNGESDQPFYIELENIEGALIDIERVIEILQCASLSDFETLIFTRKRAEVLKQALEREKARVEK